MLKPERVVWAVISAAVVFLLVAVAFRITEPSHATGEVEISLTGLVSKNRSFSMDDLRAMPAMTVMAELICVSGQSFGVHNWTGVRLSYLLNSTGLQPTAIKVAFYATDGYQTDLKLEDAMRGDVIVAYLEDGAPMSEKTRLVVPGMWGYKWIAGIETIKPVDYNFMGDWEGRGYPDNATIEGL